MKGILFASFGSTYPAAREQNIDAVAEYLQASFPHYTVAQAYTSSIVRGSLQKQGIHLPDPVEALKAMAKAGITHVMV